jgi:TonB C terminal
MKGKAGRWSVTGAGAIASLALHMLLIAPLILGGTASKTRPPNKQGAGASEIVSAQEPVMTLVYLNQASPNQPSADDEIASRGFASADTLIQVASPDPTPAFDSAALDIKIEDSAAMAEAVGDQAGHARLFGRYLGQIQARIERAWMRPRTAIGATLFSCRVQIAQDRRGNVKETALQHCNGDHRWQQSLVAAIQTASPLPAPPDPSAFADAVTLEFESTPYVAGQSDQGFEPETRETLAAAAEARSRGQLLDFERQLRSGAGSAGNSIDLRISGTPTAPPPSVNLAVGDSRIPGHAADPPTAPEGAPHD